MIYPYSKRKINDNNSHTKTIIRVSHGFESSRKLRIRSFLIISCSMLENKKSEPELGSSDTDFILDN